MSWVDYFLLILGLSWAAVGIYRWYAIEKNIVDSPNDRSSHTEPKPRGGGIVFVLGGGVLAGILCYFELLPLTYAIYFLPAFLIGILGYLDDRVGLSVSTRMIMQFLCAAALLFLLQEGGALITSWLPLPLPLCFLVLVVGVVWFTNVFNFMDGIDGIATTEAMFCIGLGGFFFYEVKGFEMATLSWGMVALLTGFLTWNWPTAKIFMGDAGSGFLGFVIVTMAIIGYKLFQIPIFVWVILTGLFWYDTTVTLIRRMLAREKFLEGHCKHAYQRMVQYGWKHYQVLLATLLINSLISCLAVWAFYQPDLTPIILGIELLFLTCLYILVEIAKPMYKTWHSDVKLKEYDF